MKKTLTILVALTLALSLTACGVATSPQSSSTTPLENSTPPVGSDAPAASVSALNTSNSAASLPQTDAPTEDNKILVVYFSKTNSTKTIGDMIATSVGGDVLHIQPQTPYPEDYTKTTELAMEEQTANARPPLAEITTNVEDYDIIFLGYPNWWGTLPMPMFTFLESYDFSEKTIIPFATHAGSGLGRGPSDIATLCPDATLLDGLAVRGTDVSDAKAEVDKWIDASGNGSISLQSSSTDTTHKASTNITMTVGETVITATLDNSETSKAFLATLPRTIAMTEYGEREFYGRMEAISENGTSIPDFENGDVTYYTHGPSLAIFYANSAKSDLDGLVRMGKITSDLAVFEALDKSTEMRIEVAG